MVPSASRLLRLPVHDRLPCANFPSALPLRQVIRMVGESQEPVGSTVGGGSTGSNKMPTLEEYGTNLTTLAEEVSGEAGWG